MQKKRQPHLRNCITIKVVLSSVYEYQNPKIRRSCWKVYYKRNIQIKYSDSDARLRGKHLCCSIFLLKMHALLQPFLEKEILPKAWPCKFSEIFQNTVFVKHLQETATANCAHIVVFIIFMTKSYRSFDKQVNSFHEPCIS